MNENDKEVLINFIKYNKFYKDEKDGRLIMSMNIGAKEMLDKSIKNMMNSIEEKNKIIDKIKMICNNNKPYIAQSKIKQYLEKRCN